MNTAIQKKQNSSQNVHPLSINSGMCDGWPKSGYFCVMRDDDAHVMLSDNEKPSFVHDLSVGYTDNRSGVLRRSSRRRLVRRPLRVFLSCLRTRSRMHRWRGLVVGFRFQVLRCRWRGRRRRRRFERNWGGFVNVWTGREWCVAFEICRLCFWPFVWF